MIPFMPLRMKTSKNIGFLKLLVVLVVLAIITTPAETHGQSIKRQAISSYGGSANINDITISHTVGQCFNTNSNSSDGLTVLKGFQQPVTLAIIPDKKLEDDLPQLSLYPNPATFSVTIESASMIEELGIRIFDMTGKVLYINKVNEFLNHTISCERWPNGIYVIQAIDSAGKNKQLKLIITK